MSTNDSAIDLITNLRAINSINLPRISQIIKNIGDKNFFLFLFIAG